MAINWDKGERRLDRRFLNAEMVARKVVELVRTLEMLVSD
jgi:hypothetical protein